jgi:lipopolysaccharide transport system ATP-binding protein
MSDLAIRAEGISKAYTITHQTAGRYKTLQEDVISLLKAPLRRGRTTRSTFWALKDVSFEVKQGEVLGIIGRNGAGKSTLLKILSRITKPTRGYADVYGRVGSLLEVGTGFHPELTGRENIFLNGAILGMSRTEIQRRFDEIVEFAEVSRFLDTPAKRYSSGMYMRLAFAVAAHLDPEVLVVDEVLAVGDAEFQKKCLGKMGEVARSGRTVLFVSHNMAAVESLCQRVMLLEQGQIRVSDEASKVISIYLSDHSQVQGDALRDCNREGNGKLRLVSFHLEDEEGRPISTLKSGSPVVFAFEFENHGLNPNDRVSLGFSVQTEQQIPVFYYNSSFSDFYYRDLPQRGILKCRIDHVPLASGNYLLGCRVVMNGDDRTGDVVDYPQVRLPLTVNATSFYGGERSIPYWGPVVVKGEWSAAAMGDSGQ